MYLRSVRNEQDCIELTYKLLISMSETGSKRVRLGRSVDVTPEVHSVASCLYVHIPDFEESSGAAYGVAVLGDYIYWTDARERTINRFPKGNITDREQLVRLSDVGHLTAVQKDDLERRGTSS